MDSMSKFVCKHPWSHFEVNNPNGDVTMCCNNDTVLGNVNEGSLSEIWNGPDFQNMRRRMQDEGAHAFCPPTCPVLQGGKRYENLDWFTELRSDGEVRKNAELNESEFDQGKVVLDSAPRWLRFTYSYACNLDCYHCYQREDAKIRRKLPDSFMEEAKRYSTSAQVIMPFGGEPFFFKPVLDFIDDIEEGGETRFFFITNGTILTDRIWRTLERMQISCMAVSLDAATASSYDTLRVRGRNAEWATVMNNLVRYKQLKETKNFQFTLSMTVNSVNAMEIESFVDLALSLDAEPLILLVANPDQTMEFHKKFLVFSGADFSEMDAQIERSLSKVRAKGGLSDAETYLEQLRAVLRQHRDMGNNPLRFAVTNFLRKSARKLPACVREPLRKVVTKARTKRFEKYRAGPGAV